MKIKVIRKDGSKEIITLTEPLTIVRGEQLNYIRTSTGMEHWFDQDGNYDGWGAAVNMSSEEAVNFIEQTEKEREIEPQGQTGGDQ